MRGQVFEADGARSGSEFVIPRMTGSDQLDPSLASLPEGKFVAVWQDNSRTGEDKDDAAVRGQAPSISRSRPATAGTPARGGGQASLAKLADFAPGEDAIRLDHNVFAGLDPGALGDAAFYAGRRARAGRDQDDLIVYDTKSGKLYFDADGAGGEDAILFAKVAGGPELGHGDFLVI